MCKRLQASTPGTKGLAMPRWTFLHQLVITTFATVVPVSAEATTIDFDAPDVVGAQTINPLVASGVTFRGIAVRSGECGVEGLCDDGSGNQVLCTGPSTVSLSGDYNIAAILPHAPPVRSVSVDIHGGLRGGAGCLKVQLILRDLTGNVIVSDSGESLNTSPFTLSATSRVPVSSAGIVVYFDHQSCVGCTPQFDPCREDCGTVPFQIDNFTFTTTWGQGSSEHAE